MRARIKIWQVGDAAGRPVSCEIISFGTVWQVRVARGRDALIVERHASSSDALQRSTEILTAYREIGWREPIHKPFGLRLRPDFRASAQGCARATS